VLDSNRLAYLDQDVFKSILTVFKAGGYTNSFISAAASKKFIASQLILSFI